MFRLWRADLGERAIGGNLVLHTPQRRERRNNRGNGQPLLLRGQDGHLFLRRKQQVGPSCFGYFHGRAQPTERIRPEVGDRMDRSNMTGETREAEFRRRQRLDLMAEFAQPPRGLAGSEPGSLGKNDAHRTRLD